MKFHYLRPASHLATRDQNSDKIFAFVSIMNPYKVLILSANERESQ